MKKEADCKIAKAMGIVFVLLYICIGGGCTYNTETPHSHIISSAWTGDMVYHWHKADCGIEEHNVDKEEHIWDGGRQTLKATCANDGEKIYICTICGRTKTEVIEKTTRHRWDSGKITIPATETTEGEMEFTCTVCDEKKYEVVQFSQQEQVFENLDKVVLLLENHCEELEILYNSERDEVFLNSYGYKIVFDVDNAIITDDLLSIPYEILNNFEVLVTGMASYNTAVPNKSGILLSFDDHYLTAWQNHLEDFKNNGIKATFFIYGAISSFKSFAKNAQSQGFEIGYHTLNHTNLFDKDSETVLQTQAIDPLYDIRHAYIYVRSFAFPNGWSVPYQIDELLKYYQIVRFFNNKFNLYTFDEISEKRAIYSQSIDKNKFKDTEDFKAKILRRLIITKLTNSVYPCTTHNILASYDDTTDNNYSISEECLYYLFDVVNSLNLKSYLYNEFYKGN